MAQEHNRGFYEEALSRMHKYFGKSLRSKTMEALSVLDPECWRKTPVDVLRWKWRILTEQWTNIINIKDIPDMMDEVSSLACNIGGL